MASIKDRFYSKIQLFLTLVLILFLAVTGATYAYFAAQTGTGHRSSEQRSRIRDP